MPLQFRRSRCTGCKLCQLACSATHEQVFNPEKSRIKIDHVYREDGIHIASKHCTFCKECEAVCPEGAISNNEKWMIVDWDICVGCGTCVEKCPTEIIYLNPDNKSVICDQCGGTPQCVQWCPKNAVSLFKKKMEAAR